MSDLPQGWEWATLGEVAHYANGRGFKKSEWGPQGRPIIRIQNLTGSGSAHNYFSGDLDDRHIIRKGDLLVSWAASLGVHTWNDDREGALNQHIFKVIPWIDRKYLRYALQHALADLRGQTHGSGMVHITRTKFDNTPIAVPPLAEQRRIVDALEDNLSRLDSATASVNRARCRLSNLGASFLSGLLKADPETQSIPNGWHWKSLEELSAGFGYGTSTKCDYSGEGEPVLRISNVQDGRITSGDLKYAIDSSLDLSKFHLRPGDLLFVRTNGSPSLIGRSAVVTEAMDAAFASYLIRFRVPDPELSQWIHTVLSSPKWRQIIVSAAASSAGQYNLNSKFLASLMVPVAPRDQVVEILSRVDTFRADLARLRPVLDASLTRSQALRTEILRAAFTGQLVDQDPLDEPASELLARIGAAAKARTPATRRTTSRKVSAP